MAFTIDNDGLGRPNQAQFGKRRTNVFAREYNAVVLRGVSSDSCCTGAAIPTFSFTVNAGGNSVNLDLSSANAASFKYLVFVLSDSCGQKASAKYTGSALTVDTSAFSKGAKSKLVISLQYEPIAGTTLSDCTCADNYSIEFCCGWSAGESGDTNDFLDSDISGLEMSIAAEYTTGPDQTTIDVASIAGIGLGVEIFENAVSIGTGTIDDNGNFQLVDAGTRVPGDYIYKVVITTAGASLGSFNETTITVV